jgi:hypothetical protein
MEEHPNVLKTLGLNLLKAGSLLGREIQAAWRAWSKISASDLNPSIPHPKNFLAASASCMPYFLKININ